MALTSVAHNSTGTLNHAGQQKAAEQANGKEKATRPSEENPTSQGADKVTLSQSEKVTTGKVAIDEQQLADLLPNAKEAILKNSKAALASQANVNAQVAREILAES